MRILLTAVLLSTTMGCGWADRTEVVEFWHRDIGGPAWSDDGSDVAAARWQYEESRTPDDLVYGGYETRDHRFQIFTQDVDGGGDPDFLTGDLPGRPRSLHYKLDAGYILASAEPDGDNPNIHAWHRVGLDGSSTHLRTENGTDVPNHWLPSPDGSVIARVGCNRTNILQPQTDPGTGWSLAWGECALEWLDPDDASSVHPPQRLSFVWNDAITQTVAENRWAGAAIWLPSGDLIVTDWRDEAVQITPGGTPTAVPVPTCDAPRSASSRVDATGRRLGVVQNEIEIVDTNATPFGCP